MPTYVSNGDWVNWTWHKSALDDDNKYSQCITK